MKICVVSLNIVPYFQAQNGSPYGGAEVQAAVLAEAMRSQGAKVVLVVSDREDELPFPSENAFRSRDGIPGTRFLYPRMPGILDALRRADADVYYQHCAGMVTGLAAWFCRKHGRVFVYGAGSNTDFSAREVRLHSWRDRVLYLYGLRNAHGIVAQNALQAAACRERLRREPLVIPTAVTAPADDRVAKERLVLWVGAVREVKQPYVLLDLARRLPDVQFALIGGDAPTTPEFCRAFRAEGAKVPNLRMTGHLGRAEVDEYLRRAALLVNTSRVEGFPNVFLEAWARRTPVVSFVDVDGLIGGESVGEVCTDVDDMAAKTRRLLDDEPRRAAMGERGRALIDERYSADAIAPRYISYFEQLLATRTAPVT